VITYVDPTAGVRERRRQLREWGFGECHCPRCIKEAADLPLEDVKPPNNDGNGTAVTEEPKVDLPDLEKELREGFGL